MHKLVRFAIDFLGNSADETVLSKLLQTNQVINQRDWQSNSEQPDSAKAAVTSDDMHISDSTVRLEDKLDLLATNMPLRKQAIVFRMVAQWFPACKTAVLLEDAAAFTATVLLLDVGGKGTHEQLVLLGSHCG